MGPFARTWARERPADPQQNGDPLSPFPWRRALALVTVAGSLAALLTAPGIARSLRPAPDATLEQRPLPPRERLEHWLSIRAEEFGRRRAVLDAEGELIAATFADLGLSLDVALTRERLAPAFRESDLATRVRRAFSGPPREVPRFEPVVNFDAERARQFLSGLRFLQREPRDARLDLALHERVEERAGRELVLAAALELIQRGGREEEVVFALPFRALPARITLSMLPAVEVGQVLGRYETDFRGRAGPRAVNIRRAARAFDKVVLEPGATFSFNRVVGPRSEERGFVKAPVIVNDETEPGLGGGVCQAATTLHAAAVFAGLEVLERRSHSRPSGYAPLGLDATVIDGKVDLRLRNPFSTPVMLHAYFPRSSLIRVEILGHPPLGRVEHAAQVIERHPFLRRVVERPELETGSFEQKQKGGYGYDILSVVTLTLEDGTVLRRRYPSKYYPVPEVLWVGKGTLASALPPLPDGATGIEGLP